MENDGAKLVSKGRNKVKLFLCLKIEGNMFFDLKKNWGTFVFVWKSGYLFFIMRPYTVMFSSSTNRYQPHTATPSQATF